MLSLYGNSIEMQITLKIVDIIKRDVMDKINHLALAINC